MGLFSNFLKEAGVEIDAEKLNKFVQTVKEVTKEVSSEIEDAVDKATAEKPKAPTGPSFTNATRESGLSWGDEMPDEENQYNFNGSPIDYFNYIYSQEFPQYRIEHENLQRYSATVFTFWDGDRKALIVELLPGKSAAKKLREECRAAGMPYIRFYYSHPGWWNTRSYVIGRTRDALGI